MKTKNETPLAAANKLWDGLTEKQKIRFDAKKVMVLTHCCYCEKKKPFSCYEIWRDGGDTQCAECRQRIQADIINVAAAMMTRGVKLVRPKPKIVAINGDKYAQ